MNASSSASVKFDVATVIRCGWVIALRSNAASTASVARCTSAGFAAREAALRETVIDSHELSEAATDPDVNNHLLGWYDDARGEIGDICAGAPKSAVKGFAVQSEWSNADSACARGASSWADSR